MHDLYRKLILLGNHFFEWLKTANFSTACETSTLKRPPSRGSDAPHVHPRLRKRPPGCTLDCGFKTAESPALRGFVAGAAGACDCGPLSVLKSNGFHHSENLPVKFVFSSKTVPANIAQKLPSQRCSQPFLIPLFNFSHKRPTFAFTSKSGYTLTFANRITQRHTQRNRGRFGRGRYHYPRHELHVHEHLRAGYQNGKPCRFWGWVGGTLKERREPAEQRCAHARRCSEASRPRWAA